MEQSDELKNMGPEDTNLTEKLARDLQRQKDKEIAIQLQKRLAHQRLADVQAARQRMEELRKARRNLRES